MIEKLQEAIGVFIAHFHYNANFPNNIDFDQSKYADLLIKCVKDNFDYTIKLYGTNPKNASESPSDIIID